MEKVKNLNGAAEHECPVCGSWLAHWEKLSGNSVGDCAACLSHATVGAHVQKAEGDDAGWYVVPLCAGCNGRDPDEVFVVFDELVPAVACKGKGE